MSLALVTDSPTIDMSVDTSTGLASGAGDQTGTRSGQSGAATGRKVTDRVSFWHAIHQTSRDVDKLARATLERLSTAAHMALVDLHEDMRERLQLLRTELAGHAEHELMMLILVFYFDERVMRQLPDSARLRWVPLQSEWIGSSHGGTEFYRILDKLLQDETTASIVFELFYYCLRNGFVGRYANNPDAIETYKKYLASRIEVPVVATEPAESYTTHNPLPRTWHPVWYYVLTFVGVILIIALMTLATNC